MTPAESSDQVRGRVLAGLAFVAALVATASVLLDRVTVASGEALGHLGFGFPMTWLVQDQSALSPPYPTDLSPASPWENPTSVAIGPLVVDALVAYVLLVGGWLISHPVLRHLRTSHGSH
ncbi:hypothetical protein [Nocardioides sp. InS609-2]|uniref:hypothetical protein n=1 Tax=Nocardioides sp. InS609-2 TaxID=2760705 RepID=UPI0020BD7294|nr:hypothetical protein [Nocardioides sp. InS609-2]